MESTCEVNNTPNKDNWESQSLKNQGNIYRAWSFLHQSSKPESTITSKTIEFKSIESQDDSGRCSKIITSHGMLKVALSTFLILLITSTSLSIFLVMKHVTKNHDPTKESNTDHASLTSEEISKLDVIQTAFRNLAKIPNAEHSTLPTNASSSSTSSPEELSSTMHDKNKSIAAFEISTTDKSIESKTSSDANLHIIQINLSSNNFEIVEVVEAEISKFSKTMTNHDAMLKSKHAEDKTTIANTLESPNEEEVNTKSPTIIQQEEMSQALAESLKCSIRYWHAFTNMDYSSK